MNKLRCFPCQGIQCERTRSLDGANACVRASRDAARSSADLLDTVSSLEALRCTDLQMHGVFLGLEEMGTADGCKT